MTNPLTARRLLQSSERLTVRVAEIRRETSSILTYILDALPGEILPAYTPGSHIDVFLSSGEVRQYSLISDPTAPKSYVISVLQVQSGRGGSRYMHQQLAVGQEIEISLPRNNFSLAKDARRHIFIAGGIGITPILAMIRSLAAESADWELHYCIRDKESAAFLGAIAREPFASRSTVHADGGDPVRGMKVESTLDLVKAPGTHLYCCGPVGLMDRVRAASSGWAPEAVHFESFNPLQGSNEAFEVELLGGGEVYQIPANKSILEVLRLHGKYVPAACTQGVCGTCIVDLVAGEADHRDQVLLKDERTSKITICCSRAKSRRLVLKI